MQFIQSLSLNASAATAWHILGERFGDLSWTATIEDSSLDGALEVGACRTCVSSRSFGPFPPGVVREKLTHFDRKARTFTYEAVEGVPSFVKRAKNTWQIKSTGEHSCIVESRAEVQLVLWAWPFGWIMPLAMRSDMKKFNEELRVAIEDGPISCSLAPNIEAP